MRQLVKDSVPDLADLSTSYPISHDIVPPSGVVPCGDNEIVYISVDSLPDRQKRNYEIPELQEKLPKLKFSGNYDDLYKGKNSIPHKRFIGLERWNVVTGERLVVPLVDKSGEQITWVPDYSRHGNHSLIGRELYWFASTGLLVKTNIDSGVTEVINDELKGRAYDWMWTRFKEGKLVVYVTSYDKKHPDMVYTFDLLSGSLVHKQDVTFLRKYLGNKVIAGIEIPPHHK